MRDTQQRDTWLFDYTASKLAVAAKAKKEAHLKKLAWWTDKKKEVMDKVRECGIEVHDSVAASYASNKGAFGPQIEIDASLQRDLCECQAKILEHTAKVSDYDGWAQVLEANSESRLDLTHEDWLYFFGV